jgi:hypothetical protein
VNVASDALALAGSGAAKAQAPAKRCTGPAFDPRSLPRPAIRLPVGLVGLINLGEVDCGFADNPTCWSAVGLVGLSDRLPGQVVCHDVHRRSVGILPQISLWLP